jgi:hypothetical protein
VAGRRPARLLPAPEREEAAAALRGLAAAVDRDATGAPA